MEQKELEAIQRARCRVDKILAKRRVTTAATILRKVQKEEEEEEEEERERRERARREQARYDEQQQREAAERRRRADEIARRRHEDIQSERTIDRVTKSCPGCGSRIEKNEGCMHMTCTKCRYEFCWECLGPWAVGGGTGCMRCFGGGGVQFY